MINCQGFRVAGMVLICAVLFLKWGAIAQTIDIEVTKKRASQGEALFQTNLGLAYYSGQGVSQNFKEAAKWFQKAAEQEDPVAQRCLGLMYFEGKGLSKSYGAAAAWLSRAEELGDKTAARIVQPVTVLSAAEEGHSWAQRLLCWAQNNLGVYYAEGQGVVQNYKEAVKWFRKAAQRGDAVAQGNLGQCYAEGQGVVQNYKEAVKWFRKSAQQGEAIAQARFGWMYLKGKGVTQDYIEAHKWFNLAAVEGIAGAGNNRDIVAAKMTPEQIAEAQKLAREWMPKKVNDN